MGPKLLLSWTYEQCVNNILEVIFKNICVTNLMTLSINLIIISLVLVQGVF